MKRTLLFLVLSLFIGFQALAQDQITFTWEITSSWVSSVKVVATNGTDNILVNWGDGSTEESFNGNETIGTLLRHTYSKNGTYKVVIRVKSSSTKLTEFYCDNQQLISLDVSKNTSLKELMCDTNQLTRLDVSKNTALTELYCYNNQLTSLDVSKNTALQVLSCYDNQFSLSALYATYQQAKQYWNCSQYLGTQTRVLQKMGQYIPISLAGEMKLGSEQTSITATKDGNLAKLGTDYSLNYADETVSFLSEGEFELTLTNPAIISSSSDYPAKVVISVPVVSPDQITLTWAISEGSLSKLVPMMATTGTNNIVVDWGDGTTQSFSGNGDNSILYLPHIYATAGDYQVVVRAVDIQTDLISFSCVSENLTSLDVSKSTALTELRCHINDLTSLDVSKNTALTELNCYNNELTSLDVSKNTALTELDCGYNKISELDVSKNTALTSLGCHTNQLTSLDVSKNTALTELRCHTNQLTSLDVSKNTALTTLYCYSNQLSLSDLYAASERVKNVSNKRLGTQIRPMQKSDKGISVSFTGQMKLGGIETTIAVTKNGNPAIPGTDYQLDYTNETITFLTKGAFDLTLTNSAITSNSSYPVKVEMPIDVEKETPDQIKLTWTVSEGKLSKSLTVKSRKRTGNIKVDWGDGSIESFSGNGFDVNTYISLSHTYAQAGEYEVVITSDILTYFSCNGGQVTQLDVSQCSSLTGLQCFTNQLTSLDVSKNTALTELYCGYNKITELDVSKNTALTELDCRSNQITQLDVSQSPSLTHLGCSEGSLASLNISKNQALISLNCSNSQLTSLDVSKHPALTTLYCYNNQLTELDVSKLTALTLLKCFDNPLTRLDITKNTKLTELRCDNNQLTQLDISNNTALTSVRCDNNSLTLQNLYTVSEQIQTVNNKSLGTQTLTVQKAHKNTPVSIDDLILGGVRSSIEVKTEMGKPAISGIDYLLDETNNKITILREGGFNLTLTNTAITSHNFYPAKVVQPIYVEKETPDQITLSWIAKEGELSKSLYVRARKITGNIQVDWGDGSVIEYFSGNGVFSSTTLSHTYAQAGEYKVTISSDILTYLSCSNKNLIQLDVSQSLDLTMLYCYNNQLEELDISQNTALTTLYCYNNQLPLSNIFAASERIQTVNNKYLGKQTRDTLTIGLNRALPLAGQMILDGEKSKIEVTKGESPAILGTDYELNEKEEAITFLNEGIFTLTLTNDSITSHATYPAKVVMPVQVIQTEEISLSWSAQAGNKKTLVIQASEGSDNVEINWGDGKSERFSGKGTTSYIYIYHTYDQAGEYQVTIRATDSPTNLLFFNCSVEQVSQLDITQSPALTGLRCYTNELTRLDISENVALTEVNCSGNQLTDFDISKNTALTYLDCAGNELTQLDLSANTALTNLDCSSNELTELDISENKELAELYCTSNELTSLDLSKNTALTNLDCSSNELTELKLNTAMTYLGCYRNQLPLSDLYVASELIEEEESKLLGTQTRDSLNTVTKTPLSLEGQMMLGGKKTTIEVSKEGSPAVLGTDFEIDEVKETITFLTGGAYTLTLSNPAIKSVSYAPARVVMPVQVTQVDEISLTWIAETGVEKTLYVSGSEGTKSIVIDWGDGNTDRVDGGHLSPLAHSYGESKSYTVTISAPNLTHLNCQNNQATSLDLTKCPSLIYLNFYTNQLESLDVSQNRALTTLYFPSNGLTSIDLSNNPALANLWTAYNPLKNLDLSHNPALVDLWCERNQLESLDLSHNPALTDLTCSHNPLTSLDLSHNPALTTLTCIYNQLDSLDLSHNPALTDLACSNNPLTHINLSHKSDLTRLSCTKNQLPLSELLILSKLIKEQDSKALGTQTLTLQEMETQKALSLAGQMTLEGSRTKFVVTKKKSEAVEGIDYLLDYTAETITFLTRGEYTLTLTNEVISSNEWSPAVVVIPVEVVQMDKITLTWTAEAEAQKTLYIKATKGTDNIEINWGDGETERSSVKEKWDLIFLSHTYKEAGEYTVTINATDLASLNCSFRQVASLDLSQSPILTSLNCQNNHLPLSELYVISELFKDMDSKYIEGQTLTLQDTETKTPLSLEGQMILGDVRTNFVVTKSGVLAVENTDYQLDYTAETITFLSIGQYKLTLTNEAISSNNQQPTEVEISVQVRAGVDIADVAGEVEVKLYPNPMKELLYIESTEKVERLTIYDLSGQIVKEWIEPEATINVSDLNKGTYLIQVNGKTTKVIKE